MCGCIWLSNSEFSDGNVTENEKIRTYYPDSNHNRSATYEDILILFTDLERSWKADSEYKNHVTVLLYLAE